MNAVRKTKTTLKSNLKKKHNKLSIHHDNCDSTIQRKKKQVKRKKEKTDSSNSPNALSFHSHAKVLTMCKYPSVWEIAKTMGWNTVEEDDKDGSH